MYGLVPGPLRDHKKINDSVLKAALHPETANTVLDHHNQPKLWPNSQSGPWNALLHNQGHDTEKIR